MRDEPGGVGAGRPRGGSDAVQVVGSPGCPRLHLAVSPVEGGSTSTLCGSEAVPAVGAAREFAIRACGDCVGRARVGGHLAAQVSANAWVRI